MKTDK